MPLKLSSVKKALHALVTGRSPQVRQTGGCLLEVGGTTPGYAPLLRTRSEWWLRGVPAEMCGVVHNTGAHSRDVSSTRCPLRNVCSPA